MSPVVRPELELILCCAKTTLSSDDLQRIKTLIQQDLDWDYFVTTSRLQKVIPLMYLNLAQIAQAIPNAVPPDTLQRLQAYVQAITRSNLLFVRELLTLTKLFASHNVAAIPYKGIVLAADLYGDLALRQFVDLDFLVSRTEYSQAQALLRKEGYYTPPQNQVDWECSFAHPERKIGVDLHQGITPAYFPFYIDFPRLWQRLRPVSVCGITINSFSPEDLLIILCVQLAKDSQWTAEVLLKVCDLAELLRVYPDLNWNFVGRQCSKLGTKRVLLFALGVAAQLLQTPIPEQIKRQIKNDIIVQTSIKQVCSEFFQRSEKSFLDRTYVERPYLIKLARERWQDKIRYFITTAVSPNKEDLSFVSLPPQLSFLYYLLRPVRLLLKYTLTLK
ncbi:MAG: nucleotidyltransferase family protein [Cyanobacteria bacterium J06648_1]